MRSFLKIGSLLVAFLAALPPLIGIWTSPASGQSQAAPPTITINGDSNAINLGGGTINQSNTINKPTIVNNYVNAWISGFRTLTGQSQRPSTLNSPSFKTEKANIEASGTGSQPQQKESVIQTMAETKQAISPSVAPAPEGAVSGAPPPRILPFAVFSGDPNSKHRPSCVIRCLHESRTACRVELPERKVIDVAPQVYVHRCESVRLISGSVEGLSWPMGGRIDGTGLSSGAVIEPSEWITNVQFAFTVPPCVPDRCDVLVNPATRNDPDPPPAPEFIDPVLGQIAAFLRMGQAGRATRFRPMAYY